MLVLFLLLSVGTALKCVDDTMTAVSCHPTQNVCHLIPKYTGGELSARPAGCGTHDNLEDGFLALLGGHNTLYSKDYICLLETYNFGERPKSVMRCACAFDYCNGEFNLAKYLSF